MKITKFSYLILFWSLGVLAMEEQGTPCTSESPAPCPTQCQDQPAKSAPSTGDMINLWFKNVQQKVDATKAFSQLCQNTSEWWQKTKRDSAADWDQMKNESAAEWDKMLKNISKMCKGKTKQNDPPAEQNCPPVSTEVPDIKTNN